MPYENEHAFRVKSPESFESESFRRKSIANGIDIVIGKLKGESTMTTQAYRFNKSVYSYEEAKTWIESHKISTIKSEEAKKDGEPHVVVRFDRNKLTRAKRHDKGFLTAWGTMSRVGVQEYIDSSGQIKRELRLPEEVFDEASLESFNGIPVTDDHPRVVVTSENARNYQRGITGDVTQKKDDNYTTNKITVTDKELVDKIDKGKVELSAGYECILDNTPGEHKLYGKYDAIQRQIRGNHLAIVCRARAGREARLHLDSYDTDVAIFNQNEIKMKKIKIFDKEIEVSEDSYEEISDSLTKMQKKLEDEDEKNKKLCAENEALKKEKENKMKKTKDSEENWKEKYDELEKSIPLKVKEYATVLDSAEKILGEEEFKKIDTVDVVEIKKIVLKASNVDFANKTDAYIDARFDVLCEGLKKKKTDEDELAKALSQTSAKKEDTTEDLQEKAKEKLINNWKNGIKK